MISRRLLYILFFISSSAFGQQVRVDTFKIKGSDRLAEISEDFLNFPLIFTGNKKVDSLINFDLKNRFTSYEYPTEAFDSTLIKWVGDGLVYIDFEVTFNDKDLLSLQISAEGCGAYCTYWTAYFNYNTQNGSWLELQDILEIREGFQSQVKSERDSIFKKLEKVLLEDLNDPDSGLGREDYDAILEYYKECQSSFSFDQFALYSDSLQVIEDCYVPHYFLPYKPIIELKYSWSELLENLKVRI